MTAPALVALAALAVGLAAALAAAVAAGRRRRRLNGALHELRRPLQSVALALEGASPDPGCARACLAQARAALDGVDALVNGRERAAIPTLIQVADLLAALERRWRYAGIEVGRPGAGGRLIGDRARIEAALDNLVANALRHGRGPVRVRAAERGGETSFEVLDRGPAAGLESARGTAHGWRAARNWTGASDPRHGHGLEVVGAVAAAHAGRAMPPRRSAGGGTVAALTLPSQPANR